MTVTQHTTKFIIMSLFSKFLQSFTAFFRPTQTFPPSSPLIYCLESPKIHLFEIKGQNIFSGWVFYFGDKVVNQLAIYLDAQLLTHVAVNLPRPDIAAYVSSVPAVANSGFSFILPELPDSTQRISVEVVLNDGSRLPFFDYDVQALRNEQPTLQNYQAAMNQINMPSGELIHLTQGHTRVEEYKNTIIPAVLNMQRYLQLAGIDLKQIKRLLDFGCGSARLLVGWHVLSPAIQLEGCDYNQQLIEWAQTALPPAIHCQRNQLQPPLPYENQSLDFIYLISVFTHLSLETQQRWVQEFKRILRRGGYVLVTLHGHMYVQNTFYQQADKLAEFQKTGFITIGTAEQEGSNHYGAFHRPDFVQQLFAGFKIVGYFPCGNVGKQHTLYQIAQSQDVYVLQYMGN